MAEEREQGGQDKVSLSYFLTKYDPVLSENIRTMRFSIATNNNLSICLAEAGELEFTNNEEQKVSQEEASSFLGNKQNMLLDNHPLGGKQLG